MGAVQGRRTSHKMFTVFGMPFGKRHFEGKRDRSLRARSNRRKGRLRAAARVLLFAVASAAGLAMLGGAPTRAQLLDPSFDFTTFPASGATHIYVADLRPNATYGVTCDGCPTSVTADTAGVLAFDAAGTGDITVRGDMGSSGGSFSRGTMSAGEVRQ